MNLVYLIVTAARGVCYIRQVKVPTMICNTIATESLQAKMLELLVGNRTNCWRIAIVLFLVVCMLGEESSSRAPTKLQGTHLGPRWLAMPWHHALAVC